MRDLDNLCVNCFEELTEGAVCAQCGYDNSAETNFLYLAPKTLLLDRYAVGALQTHESDAAVYSGYDSQLDKRIIIREFYPKGIASRLEGNNMLHVRQKYSEAVEKYKKSFHTLWTTMQKMHALSAAVPVYDVFEENKTVYAIIEYSQSITLREYLLRNEEGFISWDSARLMFMPVLTTIEALHANGIIHGSITPDNLVLCRDGKVKLSPFCISECTDSSSDFEFVEADGYTALEQYDNDHKICEATDIYSFAACIYRALVGTNPPKSTAREANDKLMIPNSIAEQIPMHVIKAMGGALQIYPEKRTKSISHFRELLDAAPSVKANAQGTSEKFTIDETRQKHYTDYAKLAKPEKNTGSRALIAVLAGLIILAIGAGFYIVKYTDLITPHDKPTTEDVSVETYEVPNFTGNGYTRDDVENNGAWNVQFNITFQEDFSKDVEAGLIFKQSVNAGEVVEQGTDIILTVSKGIQTAEVPDDLGGKTLEEATKELEELGFKVSSVEVYNDGSHEANTIKDEYSSAPEAGAVAAVGEEIILQVYGEVQTTTAASETSTTTVTENTDD